MPNEIEESQQSDTEFKAMVIKELNELTENDQKQGTYCKLYQHEKGNSNYQQETRANEEYNV